MFRMDYESVVISRSCKIQKSWKVFSRSCSLPMQIKWSYPPKWICLLRQTRLVFRGKRTQISGAEQNVVSKCNSHEGLFELFQRQSLSQSSAFLSNGSCQVSWCLFRIPELFLCKIVCLTLGGLTQISWELLREWKSGFGGFVLFQTAVLEREGWENLCFSIDSPSICDLVWPVIHASQSAETAPDCACSQGLHPGKCLVMTERAVRDALRLTPRQVGEWRVSAGPCGLPPVCLKSVTLMSFGHLSLAQRKFDTNLAMGGRGGGHRTLAKSRQWNFTVTQRAS